MSTTAVKERTDAPAEAQAPAPTPPKLSAKERRRQERLTELHGQGVKVLKDLMAQEAKLTPIYRAFAEVVVGIRKEFDDWTGRSQAYRDAVAAMYAEADVPPDSQANHQAAIRYHVGNLLRETLSKRKLAELGLAEAGPAARKAEAKRETKAAATSAAQREAASAGPQEDEDPMEWARDAVTSLRSVATELPEVVVIDLANVADHEVVDLLGAAVRQLGRVRDLGIPEDARIRAAVFLGQLAELVAEVEHMIGADLVTGKGEVIDVRSTAAA